MKRSFEDYLKKNRAILDVEEPDDDFIWSGIQNELKPKKTFQINYKVASIILLAVVCGFVFNSILHPTPKVVQMTLADISPEHAKEEQFYLATIQQKWNQINSESYQKADYKEFFREMDQLEELKAESLRDFEELGGNPRLVKTLFEYYEIKIRLLELMMAEIEKNKNEKSKIENDERYY